jgi:methionine aminopeptidase
MRVMKYVKEQVEQDHTVVELCSKMSETYTTARKSKVLARVEELQDIIQSMIEQTVECSVFIKEYIGHGFSREF